MQFLYTENYAVPEPIIEPHMSSDGDGGLDVRLKNGEEFAPTPPPPPPPPPPEDWAEVPAEEVLEEAPPAEGLPEELPIVEPFDDDWDFWGAGRKKKATRKSGKSNRPSSPSGKERLRLIFQSSGYMLPPATPTSNQMSTHARPNENVHERYAEIFLCHAKLYTFADRYQIDRLKRLCLRQLHITLLNFSLYRDRVEDILHLIRFSYSNENTADKNSDSIDGLRELVVRYAACIGQELWAHEEFKELLVDENQFARDIFGKVIKVIDKKDKQ